MAQSIQNKTLEAFSSFRPSVVNVKSQDQERINDLSKATPALRDQSKIHPLGTLTGSN